MQRWFRRSSGTLGVAAGLDVCRRRADNGPAHSQLPRYQRVVEHVADPHRQVDAFLHKVDGSLQCDQFDLRLRIPRKEVRHNVGQVGRGEGSAGGDPQLASGRRAPCTCHALYVTRKFEHLAAALQRLFAGVGEAYSPCRSMQYSYSEPTLEAFEIARDHGPRHVQCSGRLGQAGAVSHFGEHLHGSDSVHRLDRSSRQSIDHSTVYLLFSIK